MSGRGIVSAIGLCLLLVAQGWLPGQDAEMVETVVRGVQARTAAITSLSGRALVAVTHSPRCAEERSDRLIEEALTFERDPLPADLTHASMLDFSFDAERRQWRCEMVDLTNSGWLGWATCSSAVEDRALRPDDSYRISLSDGKRVYTYARHENAGWVQDHDPAHPLPPEPIGKIRLRVLEGYSAKLIKDLERGYYVAAYGGEEDLEGNRCMCLTLQGEAHEPLRRWARAWVAPTLGFPTVRHEEVYYRAPASDAEKVILVSALVSRASGFAEVVTGVWCPQYIQLDRFDYTKGEGLDAWESSTTVDCLELRANTGVEGIGGPYLFPFDAVINPGNEIEYRLPHRGVSEVRPDAFGTNLAPDDIVPVQGAG